MLGRAQSRSLVLVCFVALALSVIGGWPSVLRAQDVQIAGPEVFLKNIPFSVTVSAPSALEPTAVQIRLGTDVLADTVIAPLGSVELHNVVVSRSDAAVVEAVVDGAVVSTLDPILLPGWVSILPPLLAIGLALVFREVVTSLFAGIWLGCLFLTRFNPLAALLMVANRFGRGELANPDHASIVMFTLLLGGMVGIVTRIGGMRAIIDSVSHLATTRMRGQLAAWLAGLIIFFDDYANSLVVGNTMRPLTDRLRISREKLSYIVDSTAAPVAALFLVSTWIGYEVSLIGGGLQLAANQNAGNSVLVAELQAASPFAVFLQTIPYMFYPVLAVALVGMLSVMGRDFGPMLHAERRAQSGGGVFREGAQLAADMGTDLAEAQHVPPGRWWNGALPIVVLVVTVLAGLVTTGINALGPDEARSLRNIFGGADPYSPLMWGSLLACLAALALGVSQGIVTMTEGITAWLSGLRAMVLAIVILVMAWSLGAVTSSLETASFLAAGLTDALPAGTLPVLAFLVSSLIAFATGTSWATMAILLPLVVPLAVSLAGGLHPASGAHPGILYGGIGAVLSGAIMGDHCSPISDTTVLSSTASSCDHVDHVRTQLPYALTAALVAALFGSIPSAMGVPVWICVVTSLGVLALVVRVVGAPVEQRAAPDPAPASPVRGRKATGDVDAPS